MYSNVYKTSIDEKKQIFSRADDDERDLPAEVLGEKWDRERGEKRADGGAGIEYGRGESPVLLWKIFSCGLDGRREVAGLAEREDASCDDEAVHADR